MSVCFGGPVWGRRARQTSGASVCVRRWLPPHLGTLPEGWRGVQNRPAGRRPSQLFQRRVAPHGLLVSVSPQALLPEPLPTPTPNGTNANVKTKMWQETGP